jgi:uracil-DNA glycosylase
MYLNNGFEELNKEFSKEYFIRLENFINNQTDDVFPPKDKIFNAYKLTNLNTLKVVILGQDPYHQPNQANGLSFSVNKGVKHPRSLVNVLKEVSRDCNCKYPTHGDLSPWAKQGVFLLNTILTVSNNKPASHKAKGWECFTDRTLNLINNECCNIVFMMWGNYAKSKIELIDQSKHLILQASHPSPFSARLSFNGCSHFSKANDYLIEHGIKPINWCLI